MAAILLALISLIALRAINAPPLSDKPTEFDGRRAFADLRTLAEEYPERTTGSDASNRAAIWVSDALKTVGLEPHIDPYQARIEGKDMALQNVWAVSGPRTGSAIVLVANRDTSPLDRQGANADASGVGAVLELARVFATQSHTRAIVFLLTAGDAYGAVGSRNFIAAHPELDITAAINLSEVATPDPTKVVLDGWSASDNVAPPWLWAVAESAGKAEARLPTPLPNVITQVLHLAIPVGGGSQGAFVELGIPALTLSVDGKKIEPADDTVENTAATTLGRTGRAVERLVDTLDEQSAQLPDSAPALFFSRYRRLSGTALSFALAVLLVPLVLIAVDLLAGARRRKTRLGPAWLLYVVRFAPWFIMLMLVYFANLVGLLPNSPGSAIPPDSLVAAHPRYLRLLVLAAVLVAVVYYAHQIERRLLRRTPVPYQATVTVVHLVLVAIAVLVLAVNPFSLFLILPAAALWPLARYGPWPVSRLPAWGGLIALAIGLLYFAVRLGLGFKVWWYFFLLIEDRAMPAGSALLGAALVAGALHLGHHLHEPITRRPTRAALRSPAKTRDGAGDETGPTDGAAATTTANAGATRGEPTGP